MREYRCETCGCWHVGHLPKSVRKGRRSAGQIYQCLCAEINARHCPVHGSEQ